VLDDMVAVIKGLLPDARGLKVKVRPEGLVWTLK
jgi:hypothetical protein